MTALSILLAVASGVLAVWALLVVLLRRYRPPLLEYAVWAVVALAALRVLASLGTMLGGERPDEVGPHIGYLVAALCVLPVVMGSVGSDKGLWSTGAIAVAAVAMVVVSLRLQATW